MMIGLNFSGVIVPTHVAEMCLMRSGRRSAPRDKAHATRRPSAAPVIEKEYPVQRRAAHDAPIAWGDRPSTRQSRRSHALAEFRAMLAINIRRGFVATSPRIPVLARTARRRRLRP